MTHDLRGWITEGRIMDIALLAKEHQFHSWRVGQLKFIWKCSCGAQGRTAQSHPNYAKNGWWRHFKKKSEELWQSLEFAK